MRHFPAPLVYAGAMAWTKGLALLSVPLLTGLLTPAEYGRLELLVSAGELGGLVAGAGLVDTLYRFAGGRDARSEAGRVMGMALIVAVVGLVVVLMGAPALAAAMPLAVTPTEIMLLGAAVVLESAIGVPLGWLRMHDRAWAFALLTGLRATAQVGLMAALVLGGFGVSGVLAAGAVAGFAFAALLVTRQAQETGIGFDRRACLRLLGYGVPLVGGGLAAFVLGTADRWFLGGTVEDAALGCYGLAARIAMLVALLAQPFELWWYPRRLAVLAGRDGLALSSAVVMAGLALLMLAGGAVALGGPGLVRLLAPESYAPARALVPWLALAIVLQLASSMANAGCYARRTGNLALGVNMLAAAVALALYALLIPGFGVEGAIMATVGAQAVRFMVFAAVSQRTAPLVWAGWRLGGIGLVVIGAVALGGAGGCALLGAAAMLALVVGLIPLACRPGFVPG
jgi:O-antigen/teichoic acid export membrane protein